MSADSGKFKFAHLKSHRARRFTYSRAGVSGNHCVGAGRGIYGGDGGHVKCDRPGSDDAEPTIMEK